MCNVMFTLLNIIVECKSDTLWLWINWLFNYMYLLSRWTMLDCDSVSVPSMLIHLVCGPVCLATSEHCHTKHIQKDAEGIYDLQALLEVSDLISPCPERWLSWSWFLCNDEFLLHPVLLLAVIEPLVVDVADVVLTCRFIVKFFLQNFTTTFRVKK